MKYAKDDIGVLREVLSYDLETGVISWNIGGGKRRKGGIAGCLDGQGYRVVTVNQKMYQAHRIAWALHYGEWPPQDIDHENCVKDDNRIANLRLASTSENAANRRKGVRNSSGRKGVVWNKRIGKWQAQIGVGGKLRYLGVFLTIDEAAAAYSAAADCSFGKFARAE